MSSLFSRNASAKATPPFQDEVALPSLTAAKALEQIAGWHDIEVAERRELASAISTLVRVSGVPADMLPMTPERLRTDVLDKSAAAWGVKPETRSNILSRRQSPDPGCYHRATSRFCSRYGNRLVSLSPSAYAPSHV